MRERERERERERVDSFPSFPRRHKILFGIIVTIGVIVYAAFNVWVYQYSSGNAPSPKALWQKVAKSGTGFQGLSPSASSSVIPAATPTPTPRPTGPGRFACSPEGFCNLYSDSARTQYCTITFADSLCLDQCGKKENLCAK